LNLGEVAMPERTVSARDRTPSAHRRHGQTDGPEEAVNPDLTYPHYHREVIALQRAAGNRAVSQLLNESSAQPTPTIQRWAWVSAAQVMPVAPGLDPQMKAFAADKVVRHYRSMAEFKDHAAGKTDYLGTLPASSSSPGTWVRFEPTGTNLLGEDHTLVTMEDVAAAVGTKSFIYEPFATDDLSSQPAMKAAYETENADRFKRFGVDSVADKRQFGGESLFPKIAVGFTILQSYVNGSKKLSELRTGPGYVGQPVQRYLKIAWGYATDVAGQVAQLKKAKKTVPSDRKQLAAAFADTKGDIDAFIKALPVDGYLGDALDTVDGKKKLPALSKFCQAVIVSMTARMEADTGITAAERTQLKRLPRGTETERGAAFGKWRNLYFSHAVRDAVARGVRYAGMGLNHLDYLKAEGLPPKSRAYDMAATDLSDFQTLTNNLKNTAKSP
jgi:hypothetical protein